ncbi:MAG: hypothetical protein KJO79_09445 [Verrucomicrobiae bacterium]|nr:hypothetical protein [Verrucomicrobiae bacterium]NNJ87393.1 hypothetical protein [Akkermansiaceae bacterium]
MKLFLVALLPAWLLTLNLHAQATVFVSRMWHNHQPLYWPEWNTNGGETSRVEYAWDSMALKYNRSYAGSASRHPENNLGDIFGKDDRRSAYQGGPRNSLSQVPSEGGFCLSYSGSLIDNIRHLGALGQLGYGSGWADGNREARGWTTPSGSPRLDLVGFTYHHSLAPLLPKSVFRKEVQIFKQAWWKAWNGNSNLVDHSRGFFPTEMAFSRHMTDVLVDEGYQWVIVASHHLSRTCPTYMKGYDLANNNWNIKSSPPNKADQLGPSPTSGWWFAEPNPGQAARNISPYAYQLHKAQYVNPETGATKTIIMVPSDDVMSYQYGYSNAGIGNIQNHIAPYATDPNRPVIVMPSSDGDNAWGGGSSSWFEATPQFFNDSKSSGYQATAVQDFVNWHGAAAGIVHIEDGGWIFPESAYGTPHYLKWIEPPLTDDPAKRYPGTMVDMESPGFALKFWSWAPIITGANWVETAEQILTDEGGSVAAWKIQAPYDWDGTWTSPNEVELAWHIYLGGLDSGFNYYGGLGNDDEVKPSLATRRAIEKLKPWMTQTRRKNDHTPPSVLKPQRFPWNPGAYTFGWFNSIPGGDTRYLKLMPSEFYIWTHAYDLNGVQSVNLEVRLDKDGTNTMSNTQNETYAGGPDVGDWVTVPMIKRVLPNSQSELNAAANNGQINYFITPPELADYYFAKITNSTLPGFRGKLIDYYIEATDTKGNTHKSEIQHVFVEDDGKGGPDNPPQVPTGLAVTAVTSTTLMLDWGDTPEATEYIVFRDGVQIGTTSNSDWLDTGLESSTEYCYTVKARNAAGESAATLEVCETTNDPPPSPAAPANLIVESSTSNSVSLQWDDVSGASQYVVYRDGVEIGFGNDSDWIDFDLQPGTEYCYQVVARNAGGDSAMSAEVCGTTQIALIPFAMDGVPDHANYQVSRPGMVLYAAVRGDLLYLSTWTPNPVNGNDHFLMVSNRLESAASTASPWAKAGTTAFPGDAAFLASETNNDYIDWFNVGNATTEKFRSPTDGEQMEGTLNLVQLYGSMPENIYLSALSYQDADGGLLAAQAPDRVSDDGDVTQDEIIQLTTRSIRDEDANGIYDIQEDDFVITAMQHDSDTGHISLTFSCARGYSYYVQRSETMNPPWTNMTSSPDTRITAVSNSATISFPWVGSTRHFFRVVRVGQN